MAGIVYLVGAGPGDPGLITVSGREILARADVVVYDRLAPQELLRFCRPDAVQIYVGKQPGGHTFTQDEINAVLVREAGKGLIVCRLKGGDPFVFGRGGEEALYCLEHGVPFHVVPGVTSAVAGPAYAGIPITHREVATSFAVVTGHTASEDRPPPALPRADTLIFLMGVQALPGIVERLLDRGDARSTPVAVIERGTTPRQRVVTGTLDSIVAEAAAAGIMSPALIVVGQVVGLRTQLQWFDSLLRRPLWGQTVVVTRAREQASQLVAELEERGARVLECPVIRIQDPPDLAPLDAALDEITEFDWVIFTSANGVDKFWQRLQAKGKDARALGKARLAAIGPATAAALGNHGLLPDLVPDSSISEDVARRLIEAGVNGKKVLLARALEGRDVLPVQLRAAGAKVVLVPCYQTVPDALNAGEIQAALRAGQITWITFTSSSTVKNFLDAVGSDLVHTTRQSYRVACIGPITAKTAEDRGLVPDLVAPAASVPDLVRSLEAATT